MPEEFRDTWKEDMWKITEANSSSSESKTEQEKYTEVLTPRETSEGYVFDDSIDKPTQLKKEKQITISETGQFSREPPEDLIAKELAKYSEIKKTHIPITELNKWIAGMVELYDPKRMTSMSHVELYGIHQCLAQLKRFIEER